MDVKLLLECNPNTCEMLGLDVAATKTYLPEELRQAIDELLEAKKRTTEGEENPQMSVIREFIESETARQKQIANDLEDDHNKDWTALNRLFAEIIE